MQRAFAASLVSLLIAATGGPVLALDRCGLEARVMAERKVLPDRLGVPRRSQQFIADFGIPMDEGRRGKTVRMPELLAGLERSGCNRQLFEWIRLRARQP